MSSAGPSLSLATDVSVDVLDLIAWSRGLTNEPDAAVGARAFETAMMGDLLPDWYDDWIMVERERLRQLRLHALERACVVLSKAGEYGRAIEAGLTAIREAPLHESGHAALINAHLCEGNRAEALSQYRAYARLMRDELGLSPSPALAALVRPLLTAASGVGWPSSRVPVS